MRDAAASLEDVARDREVGERQQAGARRSRPRGSARRCRRSAWRRACLEADKQHRPGERRAHLDDLAVAREQPHERAPGPVVEVARACCRAPTSRRRAPCSASATAARGEPRRAGGARRSAPSRRACARGPGRARAPRSRSPGRTRPSANGRFSASITRYSRLGAWRSAQPAWIDSSSRSMPTTRPSPSRCAQRCDEHALAAADVQQRARARRGSNSSSSVALEAAPSGGARPGCVEPYLS